jgi:hypothetical protein
MAIDESGPAENVVVAFRARAISGVGHTSEVSMAELFPAFAPSMERRRNFWSNWPLFLEILEEIGQDRTGMKRILLLAWIRAFTGQYNDTVPWDARDILSRLELMGERSGQHHHNSHEEMEAVILDSDKFAGWLIGQFMRVLEHSGRPDKMERIASEFIDGWLNACAAMIDPLIRGDDARRTSPVALRII